VGERQRSANTEGNFVRTKLGDLQLKFEILRGSRHPAASAVC